MSRRNRNRWRRAPSLAPLIGWLFGAREPQAPSFTPVGLEQPDPARHTGSRRKAKGRKSPKTAWRRNGRRGRRRV